MEFYDSLNAVKYYMAEVESDSLPWHIYIGEELYGRYFAKEKREEEFIKLKNEVLGEIEFWDRLKRQAREKANIGG